MSPTKPIPVVRLPSDKIQMLDRAAKELKIGTRAQVIRLCIEVFLDEYEACQKDTTGTRSMTLPMEWRKMVDGFDHRRKSVSTGPAALAAEADPKSPLKVGIAKGGSYPQKKKSGQRSSRQS